MNAFQFSDAICVIKSHIIIEYGCRLIASIIIMNSHVTRAILVNQTINLHMRSVWWTDFVIFIFIFMYLYIYSIYVYVYIVG